jgi:non-specific serine/threonine protein kinase/serine/threonine-protein kinase
VELNFAYSQYIAGELPEANTLARQALAHTRVLYGEEPRALANATARLGDILTKQDSLEAAEPLLRQTVELRRAVLGDGHGDVLFSRVSLGRLLARRERYAEAESLYTNALEGRRTLLGERHPAVAASLQDLASPGRGARRSRGRRAAVPRVGAIWGGAKLANYEMADFRRAATAALRGGRAAAADSLAALAEERAKASPPTTPWYGELLELRGEIAQALGRESDAERFWLQGETVLRALAGARAAAVRAAIIGRLVSYYERAGRSADAATWRARVAAPPGASR